MKTLKDYNDFISELNEDLNLNSKVVSFKFKFDNQDNFEKFISTMKHIFEDDYFKKNYPYNATIEDEPIIVKNNIGIVEISFGVSKAALTKVIIIIKNIIETKIKELNFNISIKDVSLKTKI